MIDDENDKKVVKLFPDRDDMPVEQPALTIPTVKRKIYPEYHDPTRKEINGGIYFRLGFCLEGDTLEMVREIYRSNPGMIANFKLRKDPHSGKLTGIIINDDSGDMIEFWPAELK